MGVSGCVEDTTHPAVQNRVIIIINSNSDHNNNNERSLVDHYCYCTYVGTTLAQPYNRHQARYFIGCGIEPI